MKIGAIKEAAKEIDRHAFIIVQNISDVEGGLVKKSEFH